METQEKNVAEMIEELKKRMRIYVVFDIPGIDPDSEDTDDIIDVLEDNLDELNYEWYIDEVVED